MPAHGRRDLTIVATSNAVALVGHLAWPVAVLAMVALFRRQLVGVAGAIERRVLDRSTDVSLGRSGLTLTTRVATLEATAETQQIKSEVLARAVTAGDPVTAAASMPQQALGDLAEAYRAVDDSDYRERLRKKNEVADAMGALILRYDLDRRVLAESGDEVLTLALATAVMALPKAGDDDLLAQAGPGVERLHVRYRLASAIGQLADSRVLRADRVGLLTRLLESYSDGADPPLVRRLERTRIALLGYANQRG